MKKAASLLPVLFATGLAGSGIAASCPPERADAIQVGAQRFQVEVAATDTERQRGLSGRPRLATDRGMWFVMPDPGLYGFWMRDMAFAIDLIWIDPNWTVLDSVRLEPCLSYACPVSTPPAPAAYVLEVNAGQFAGRPGDQVTWTCPSP